MATNSLTSFRPAQFRASSSKPDPNRSRKPASVNWWAPLFGFQSEPDYLATNAPAPSPNADPNPEPESESDRRRSRFFPGCFTEEKAKQLRRKTLESSTFHDVMYHSAIASRLATDFSKPKEDEK